MSAGREGMEGKVFARVCARVGAAAQLSGKSGAL